LIFLFHLLFSHSFFFFMLISTVHAILSLKNLDCWNLFLLEVCYICFSKNLVRPAI
jgi:hypothetical protein